MATNELAPNKCKLKLSNERSRANASTFHPSFVFFFDLFLLHKHRQRLIFRMFICAFFWKVDNKISKKEKRKEKKFVSNKLWIELSHWVEQEDIKLWQLTCQWTRSRYFDRLKIQENNRFISRNILYEDI